MTELLKWLKIFLLTALALTLIDCAGGAKKGDDELDEDTTEAVEGLTPEEKAELEERKAPIRW